MKYVITDASANNAWGYRGEKYEINDEITVGL